MAHGMYRIKVVKWCKRQEVIFQYAACAHPQKDEVIWYRDKQYVVGSVAHITKTSIDGNGETTSLDFVELEVL